MSPNKQLIGFVNSLPVGPAYTPIYAKGVVYGKNRIVSKGKNPHEDSFKRHMSPGDVALFLERDPNKFVAAGLFTGIRSQGLVILDVDANLATLSKKWGDSLKDAPKIISTKKNAAKYVFRVPEDQRSQVKGFGLSHTGEGYEVLWGKQGVIAGTYPGSSDGKAPAGTYKLAAGDFNQIPQAPEWLLAEMRARYVQDTPSQTSGLVKNRKGLDFSGRTEDEIAEIIRDCLTVLPQCGRGNEDDWWIVGAMIAEDLPNDLGLTLWSAWSAEDSDYEEDWKNGNPCAEKWPLILQKAGRPGNAGLGSLIRLADGYDPNRERFQDSSRETLEQVESSQVHRFQTVALSFEQLLERAKQIVELDNPAELNYEMHRLAVEAGHRDAEKIERILVDQLAYEKKTDAISIDALLDTDFKREYLIPDLLATPSTVLMYGSGGDGKSMAAWTLAKHIATGAPFKIRGQAVPVQKGGVLILNGDQPLIQVQEQLEEVDFPRGTNVTIRSDFQIQRYAFFIRQIEKYRPKLVIIDSLIGCSGGKAFDENKSDFATPLYWLTRNNGDAFPPTTIIVIHHANKNGNFRGSSAIRDAVDEVISLKKPTEKQIEQTGQSARILTFEKSRSGRGGTQLLMKQQADLSYTIQDWTPEVDPTNAAPSGISDRVLQRLRLAKEPRTLKQLQADPTCGGNNEAVKKALQRWKKKGLVEIAGATQETQGKKPQFLYRAVLSSRLRGECVESVPLGPDPSSGTGFEKGTASESEEVVPFTQGQVQAGDNATGAEGTKRDNLSSDSECPFLDPLQQQGSAGKGTSERSIRAGAREDDEPTFSYEQKREAMRQIAEEWE